MSTTDLIADLPIDERPRERMFRHGAGTLSDAELLAILLGSGVPGKNAVQLARMVLANGLAGLSRREGSSYLEVRGIGPAKTARILAAIELSRRILSGNPPDERTQFDAHVLGARLIRDCAHHTQERLGAVFLDSRHRLLSQREVYVGTINSALVATRDIVRLALVENATAVVVFHNHPSGSPLPSADDLGYTTKLQHALRLVDLELVDHIIVGSHRFHSMAERGEL